MQIKSIPTIITTKLKRIEKTATAPIQKELRTIRKLLSNKIEADTLDLSLKAKNSSLNKIYNNLTSDDIQYLSENSDKKIWHWFGNGDLSLIRKYKKLSTKEKEEIKEKIKITDMLFEKVKPLKTEQKVYRSISYPKFDCEKKLFNKTYANIYELEAGEHVVLDPAYMYAGEKDFVNTNYRSNINMEIILPKGTKRLPHGGECLLPRNSEYELLSRTDAQDGNTDVVLKYILPKNKSGIA